MSGGLGGWGTWWCGCGRVVRCARGMRVERGGEEERPEREGIVVGEREMDECEELWDMGRSEGVRVGVEKA